MARIPTPLSQTEIKNAKPKDKEYSLADGQGLALRIKPNGFKVWIFNYTNPDTQKRTNLGLGPYPDVTLAYARRQSEAMRGQLVKGIDPKLYKDQQQEERLKLNQQTLAKVVDQWFVLKQDKVTENYAQDIIRSLDNHVLPKLGNFPIHEITAPIVISTLSKLVEAGKLEAVKRVSQRLNEVMVYAVNTGAIHHNPLAGIRHAFKTPQVTNNPTLKPDQLPELMRSLSVAPIHLVTRCLIEWQLHTMSRPGEAAGTRWEEIDVENRLWVVPASRMKKRVEHVVPLTKQALAILEVIRPLSVNREHVFPGNANPRKSANSATANVALKKRMGFYGRLTAHGMRALASTTLNEEGFKEDLIEAALAHTDKNSVRRAYNRAKYVERRRVMMNWWSERIAQAATGDFSLYGSVQ